MNMILIPLQAEIVLYMAIERIKELRCIHRTKTRLQMKSHHPEEWMKIRHQKVANVDSRLCVFNHIWEV